MTTIHFTGNLTRDPDLRYTTSGKAVATMTVAENHRVRDGQGGWTDGPTTFWPVTAWGEIAEHATESLAKGDRVVVIGRTGTRTWTPTDGEHAGEEQRRLEVVAEEVAPSLRWANTKLTKAERVEATHTTGEDEPHF